MEEKSLSSPTPVYRFGVFQVNLATRELRKHGVRVRLPGQPFCILTMLLERPGEVVTREEMRRRLWAADTFVDFEHSLNTAITRKLQPLPRQSQHPSQACHPRPQPHHPSKRLFCVALGFSLFRLPLCWVHPQ